MRFSSSIRFILATCAIVILGFAASAAAAAQENAPNTKGAGTIQNEFFSVSFAEKTVVGDYGKLGKLEVKHLPSGKNFVQNLDLDSRYYVSRGVDKQSGWSTFTQNPTFGNGLTAHGNKGAQPVTDPVLGQGWKLRFDWHGKASTSIELYPGVPFIIIRPTLTASHDPTGFYDVSKFIPATFSLELGKPAKELKTLGTGGLLSPDKNPGSYLFLTAADPATRNGVVVGWLSQEVASGVVFTEVKDGKIVVRPELHLGHLFLHNYRPSRDGKNSEKEEPKDWALGPPPFPVDRRQLSLMRRSVTLDPLAIGYFDDARIGNELYAALIARFNKVKLRPQSAVYCTWYADKNGRAGSAQSTAELATFIAGKLKDHGMDTLQIDDMWQAGTRYTKPKGHPASHFDRVNPAGPYPKGIVPTAATVGAAGLRLGLWWLPFGRHHFEPEYAEKQHWFVHRSDGTPYRTNSFGGTCLDVTHPEVLQHLGTLSRDMRRWGVTYYKMDGLWTGLAVDQYYISDGYKEDHFGDHLPLHNTGKTNVEAYRDALRAIRSGAGQDVFFSGCNVAQNMRTLGASIGLVDAMRIGPDYNHDGKGVQTGPLRGSRLYFLNGKVWWNDPDPVKVRAKNGGVSLDHARLATSWVAHSGQFFLISDWLPNLDPDRLEILKRTMSPHAATTRPVDYFDNNLPEIWLLTDTHTSTRRDVLALYNWTKKDKTITASLARAGLDPAKTWHAYDFWARAPLPDLTTELKTTLPRESCQIVALRPAVGHPVLVSTSRHITQGVVDVREEKWESRGDRGTLCGASEVIAGDPYELRIAGLGEGWEFESFHILNQDEIFASRPPETAGVNVAASTLPVAESFVLENWLFIRIAAPAKTGTIRWIVNFKKKR